MADVNLNELNDATEKAWTPGLIRRLSDSLFGYDFFISYTWSDGRTYAKALARRLEADGFECFLDSDDYCKGDDWKRVGYWTLRRTSRLVLVGSPNVHGSGPVLRELKLFARFKRQIIPISFDGTLDPEKSKSPLFEFLDSDRLRIDDSLEHLESGPADAVVNDLRNTFNLMRQSQKRVRVFGVAAGIFAVVAVVAVLLGLVAEQRRVLADQESKRAWRSLGDADLTSAVQAMKLETDPVRASHFFLRSSASFAKAEETHRTRNSGLAGRMQAELVQRTLPLEGQIVGIRLCDDGQHVVAWSRSDRSSTVAVWDLETSDVRDIGTFDGQVHDVRINTACSRFVVLRNDGLVETGDVGHLSDAVLTLAADVSYSRSWISADLQDVILLGLYGEVRRWPSGNREDISVQDTSVNTHSDIPLALTIQRESHEAILWDLRQDVSGSALGQVADAVFDSGARARLAMWQSDGTLTIYTVGKPAQRTSLHHAGIKGARFSADGRRLVTWDDVEGDSTMIIWDIAEERQIQRVSTPEPVSNVVVNQNATHIVCWHADRAWLWRDGTDSVTSLAHHDTGNSVGSTFIGGACFCSDDRFVATWKDGDSAIRIWSTETVGADPDRPTYILRHHGVDKTYRRKFARAHPFSGDGLLSYGSDGLVRVWNLQGDHAPLLRCDLGRYDEVSEFESDASGEFVAATLKGRGGVLWNRRTRKSVSTPFDSDASITRMQFGRADRIVIAWKSDGSACRWQIGSDSNVVTLLDAPDDGQLLAATGEWAIATRGETTSALGARNGEKLRDLKYLDGNGRPVGIKGASLNVNGSHALTWAEDGTVQWWSSAAHLANLPHKLNGETGLTGAVLSRDGTRALTRSLDVFCWDLSKVNSVADEVQRVVLPHDRSFGADNDSPPIGAVFTQSEDSVLTWHGDGYARLWDFSTGELIREFQQEPIFMDPIQIRAVMSNDESLLLTSSPRFNAPTRLWDVESGHAIREFNALGGAFSTDSTELYVFERQGIRIIDLKVSMDADEIEGELKEFQVRSATEVTDTGEFRVLSYQQWMDRRG